MITTKGDLSKLPKIKKIFTIREALAWSDKHRSLSNNEGVRIVHIRQLLDKLNDIAP